MKRFTKGFAFLGLTVLAGCSEPVTGPEEPIRTAPTPSFDILPAGSEYACATGLATVTVNASNPGNPPHQAIDCDVSTWWSNGSHWDNVVLDLNFNQPTALSGVRVTGVAYPSDLQHYQITAFRADGRTFGVNTQLFIQQDTINSKTFDFGAGFQDIVRIRFEISTIWAMSWKAIREIELIVPVADADGDGVPDVDDAFPNDANESVDTDGDGVGDNGDAFPNDANESVDTDGDGVGDNGDAFPADPNETADSDADGLGDNADAFANSDRRATVVVGDIDSGVGNQLMADGSTFNDRIAEARQNSRNHGQFVKQVSALANRWQSEGLITGRDKGAITSAAGRSK